jgi:hypothetical protein
MDGSPATAPTSVEELLHMLTLKDVTVGIRQLEDTAADVEWQNKNKQTNGHAFSNTVQIRGTTMNKSRVIAQQFQYVTSASSTDRLWRVAQESALQRSMDCFMTLFLWMTS